MCPTSSSPPSSSRPPAFRPRPGGGVGLSVIDPRHRNPSEAPARRALPRKRSSVGPSAARTWRPPSSRGEGPAAALRRFLLIRLSSSSVQAELRSGSSWSGGGRTT